MAGAAVPVVRIQAADFDVAAEISRLTEGRADVGAVVTFSGLCRDEAGTLSALELEHYPGMAEAEISADRRGSRRALAADRADRDPPLRQDQAG